MRFNVLLCHCLLVLSAGKTWMKMMSFPIFQDGTEPVVKDVLPGDSVHSLLSILDIITVSSAVLYLNWMFWCPVDVPATSTIFCFFTGARGVTLMRSQLM